MMQNVAGSLVALKENLYLAILPSFADEVWIQQCHPSKVAIKSFILPRVLREGINASITQGTHLLMISMQKRRVQVQCSSL